MRDSKVKYLIIISLFLTAFFAGCTSLSAILTNDPNKSTPYSSEAKLEPCWFAKNTTGVDNKTIMKRQDRENYGYPIDTGLDDAVRVFNEERVCRSQSAKFEPLTADEVIAATSTSPDYGSTENTWPLQKAVLLGIRENRVLPKGSLLVVEYDGPVFDNKSVQQTSLTSRGERIYLFVGLDANPRMDMKSEQTFLIRKHFVGIGGTEDR
jgi:hypothetical protein